MELQASFAATMASPATELTDPAAAFDVEKAIDVEAPVSALFDAEELQLSCLLRSSTTIFVVLSFAALPMLD